MGLLYLEAHTAEVPVIKRRATNHHLVTHHAQTPPIHCLGVPLLSGFVEKHLGREVCCNRE